MDNNLYAVTSDGKLLYNHIMQLCVLSECFILSGTLKWSYLTGLYVHSSPVIGADGTIYVGSDDSYLYAITASGNISVILVTKYTNMILYVIRIIEVEVSDWLSCLLITCHRTRRYHLCGL
jgi:PQQ-like domain